MVEVTPEDIVAVFPEFADVDEEQIEFYIESARDYVNEQRWGEKKAKRGIMFMAAHLMSRAGVVDGTGGGATVGVVKSESVGGISTTYADPAGSSDGSFLGLTSYGEQFAMLRRTVVKTPLVT